MEHFEINIPNAVALSKLCQGVARGKKVAFIMADNSTALSGTLRHFVNSEHDYSFFFGKDIRDAYVRITLDSGAEKALPVNDIVPRIVDGYFAIDNYSPKNV